MSFSFCINRNEVLTLCGLSLLYQGLDLKQEGKLMKDGQRLVCTVVKCLDKAKAPGAIRLQKTCCFNDVRRQPIEHLSSISRY